MRRKELQHSAERTQVAEALAEAQERLQAEQDARQSSSERLEVAARDMEALRTELTQTRQAVEKAELDRAKVLVTTFRLKNNCVYG
jgi:hypothetical protein